jgi:hypothetical protein
LQSAAMADKSVSLSHTQYRIIDQNGRHVRDGEAVDTTYVDFLRGDSQVLSASVMFRKRCFQEVGGYNSLLKLGEGQDLVFRVAREGRILFLPEVLTEYRQHDSNISLGTSLGGDEAALVLRLHLLAAQAANEVENVKAVRRGLSLIAKSRVARALKLASEARSRHAYLTVVRAIGSALLIAPIFTSKAILREFKRMRRSQ